MAETKNQLDMDELLGHLRQKSEDPIQSRQTYEIVNNVGPDAICKDNLDQIKPKQAPQAPVQAADNQEDGCNPINNLHTQPPNKLIITILFYHKIDFMARDWRGVLRG